MTLPSSRCRTGQSFFKGSYIWASRQTDSELKVAAQACWASLWRDFGVRVAIVSPDTLRQLLEAGHRDEIFQEAWRVKVPPSALSDTLTTKPVTFIPSTVLPRGGH